MSDHNILKETPKSTEDANKKHGNITTTAIYNEVTKNTVDYATKSRDGVACYNDTNINKALVEESERQGGPDSRVGKRQKTSRQSAH